MVTKMKFEKVNNFDTPYFGVWNLILPNGGWVLHFPPNFGAMEHALEMPLSDECFCGQPSI